MIAAIRSKFWHEERCLVEKDVSMKLVDVDCHCGLAFDMMQSIVCEFCNIRGVRLCTWEAAKANQQKHLQY